MLEKREYVAEWIRASGLRVKVSTEGGLATRWLAVRSLRFNQVKGRIGKKYSISSSVSACLFFIAVSSARLNQSFNLIFI